MTRAFIIAIIPFVAVAGLVPESTSACRSGEISYWIRPEEAGCGGSGKIDLTTTTKGTRAPATHYSLAQNHPNPTKLTTAIRIGFELGERSLARLRIYDATGHLVRSLLDDRLEGGPHTILWDGRNEHGQRVSSGVYFYRLEAASFSAARQLVILP